MGVPGLICLAFHHGNERAKSRDIRADRGFMRGHDARDYSEAKGPRIMASQPGAWI